MSKVNFNENLFVGNIEYKRLQKFLKDEGFQRQLLANTSEFGLIYNFKFDNTNILKSQCFYVERAGTPKSEVKINNGAAFNSLGELIYNNESVNLEIPNDSEWYWIKISHSFKQIEKGNLSVDSSGNVTGVNTEFEEILRGQPNYPTKIKFLNSQNGNSDEYEVVKVIDDNNCIIAGDFNAENDLKFQIAGTFTPGYAPNLDEKNVFKKDSVNISLVPETSVNQEPTINNDLEFFISRVKYNGVTLSVEDKRKNWFKTKSDYKVSNLDRNLNNPLIGVESVTYDHYRSPKSQNIINLSFGFKIKSHTIDTSSKKVSILIGNGGIYKNTSYFSDGDFDNWRLYYNDGSYSEIIDSKKTGTQIILTLDVLNPNSFEIGDNDLPERDLFIAPPYEEIEIKVRRDGSIEDVNDVNNNNQIDDAFPNPKLDNNFVFKINNQNPKIKIPSPKGCYKYNLIYRYKNHTEYTDWKIFPDDNEGYFDETSFDIYGNLLQNSQDRNKKPYVGHASQGFIEVCEHPNSFSSFQNYIVTGDIFGVNTTELTNEIPILNLEVGQSKSYQHFIGELDMSADMYINLKRKDSENNFFREGNKFVLHISQFITKNGFRLRIVEDYVNPTDYNQIIELTENDIAFIKNNSDPNSDNKGLFVTCVFNENDHWVCHMDSETVPKDTIRMIKNVPANSFDSTTKEGIKKGFWGWKIAEDMNDLFPLPTDTLNEVGNVSGANSVMLQTANIPDHSHLMFGNGSDGANDGLNAKNQIAAEGKALGGNRSYTIARQDLSVDWKFAKVSNPVNDNANYINKQPVQFKPKHMKLLFIQKIV